MNYYKELGGRRSRLEAENQYRALALSLMLLAGLAFPSCALGQSKFEKWVAASKTAWAFTGDIELSFNDLRMLGIDYPLTTVRPISAELMNDIGKLVVIREPIAATLYRVKIPASTRLLGANTICGPTTRAG